MDLERAAESEQTGKVNLWLVEDDVGTYKPITEVMEHRKSPTLDFRHFSTGEDFAREFQISLESGSGQPDMVVMDFKLAPEDSNIKYKTGVEVIEEIKRLVLQFQVPLPEIIGFSNNPFSNEQLEAAGAKSSMDKTAFFHFAQMVSEGKRLPNKMPVEELAELVASQAKASEPESKKSRLWRRFLGKK